MTQLKLGSIDLWAPPTIYSELTGFRRNYSTTNCGSTLDSIDLTYKLFLGHFCTLAESQQLEASIEAELANAPNLTLIRQETPDALLYKNVVKSGQLAMSTDVTEIRARFTTNRTLISILTLTILPTGVGGATPFRSLRFLEVTKSFDWVGDDIKALLYQQGSTAPSELYVDRLDDFVDLLEADGVGYARADVTGRSIYNGAMLELVAADVDFASQANSSEELVGMIIYQHNGADSANVPLFDVALEPFNPDGTPQKIPVTLHGLF